jgi:hypothetical protein
LGCSNVGGNKISRGLNKYAGSNDTPTKGKQYYEEIPAKLAKKLSRLTNSLSPMNGSDVKGFTVSTQKKIWFAKNKCAFNLTRSVQTSLGTLVYCGGNMHWYFKWMDNNKIFSKGS